jgi:ABC-type thiamine transport system substrate-binding protein
MRVEEVRMVSKFIFLLVLLSWSLLGSPLYCADGDRQQRQLIEGAKKEGKLVFYTSVETEFARSLSTAFEAKYSFIKTDIFRSTHDKILSRMNVERKTGTYTADTVSVGEFETYHMQKMGFILPYKSPFAATYPEGFKDPNGYWTDLYDNLIVIAYNTKQVKRDELPKRYEDLLHPRWKGRMVLDQNEDRWFANMIYLMGEQKGMEFMQALARQEVSIRSGRGMVTQLLGAGEYDLQIVAYWYRPHLMKKQGGARGLDRVRARYRGNASDQRRQSSTPPKRGETFYRLRHIRRRTKDLHSKRQGVGEAGAEAGRLPRPSQSCSESRAARREARRV